MTTGYETRGFHALAHDFRIVSERADVGQYLERLLSGFGPSQEPTDTYRVRQFPEDADQLEIMLGEEVAARNSSVGHLAGSFVHHLNRKAIDANYAVMCHAGGVELNGVGFIFPAHMESGKTTLTTGLVRSGFAYLTDEAVAFDRATGLVEPYPKPLSIDAGSHFLFPELEPAPAPGDEHAPGDQWQVPPDAIRPDAVGAGCEVGFVLFPEYREGATTEMVPMSRAEGLLELATNTFEFRDHPRRSLNTLTAVIEKAQCFRLTVGDLDEACAIVGALDDREELLRA